MTDREVGELWQTVTDGECICCDSQHDEILNRFVAVIMKLVKERVDSLEQSSHETRIVNPLQMALKEFGISEKSWGSNAKTKG